MGQTFREDDSGTGSDRLRAQHKVKIEGGSKAAAIKMRSKEHFGRFSALSQMEQGQLRHYVPN